MSSASFRKNRFFGPGRRLAAPEGPKIVGGASLARREKPDSRPSEGGRVLRFLGPAQWAQMQRDSADLGCLWVDDCRSGGFQRTQGAPGKLREALGRPRDAPGAAQK